MVSKATVPGTLGTIKLKAHILLTFHSTARKRFPNFSHDVRTCRRTVTSLFSVLVLIVSPESSRFAYARRRQIVIRGPYACVLFNCRELLILLGQEGFLNMAVPKDAVPVELSRHVSLRRH